MLFAIHPDDAENLAVVTGCVASPAIGASGGLSVPGAYGMYCPPFTSTIWPVTYPLRPSEAR